MISVQHLTKYYGEHLAVDDLSFEISDGHVYGFLGPNGAGKSTTMNIMTGCLSASGGQVLIDGFDIFEEPKQAKKLIGYLPEQPPLYLNESPLDYLRFVGSAKGLRGNELRTEIERVIEQTGIEEVKNRRIATLSKGFKQRVGIAQALLGNPRVIVLDEPTVGLDPIQILEIRELIRELGRSHTVIFSSHILSEVRTICDRILMIARGRLVAFDEPEKLERELLSSGEIGLLAEAEAPELEKILSSLETVAEFSVDSPAPGRCSARVKARQDEDIHSLSGRIFHACADGGLTLLEMSIKKANLEDVFMELAAGEEPEPESEGEKA